MKIAIVGSRDFNDYSCLCTWIKTNVDLNIVKTVISGGAKGADSLACRFADEYGLDLLVFKPQWERYGRSAGLLRNTDIIKSADMVFAFWDGHSKGTHDSIQKANKYNKKIFLKTYDKSI